MKHIYKILRDIGIKLSSINESIPLLKEGAIAVQNLIEAQEVYALVLDENGRLHISYSSTPTPPSIETVQATGIANDCTTVFVNANGHVCIPLSKNHIIYLIGSAPSPEQIEILELFREQTAPQLHCILQHEKTAADLHEGIWAIDTEANTTFVNEQMATMLGYTVEEMMGESMFVFMDKEGIAIANENLARRKDGIKEQHPFKLVNKQGNPVYTLMETSSIEENGRYAGVLANVINITMREPTFRKLRYNEKRFRDLVEVTNDWIWEVDAKGVYTYSNKAITNLLGYMPNDILGKKPLDLIPPKEAEHVSQFLTDIVAKKAPFKDFRNGIMHKNGTTVQFLSTGAPILATDDELLGYRGIGRDITQLVRQEKERDFSQKKAELLLSVLNGMNLSPTFHTAVEVAVRLIGKHTGCIYGEAWIVASKWEDLYCGASYVDARHQARLDSFANLSKQTTYAYGEGLPGRVWRSQQVVEYENIRLIPKEKFLRINAADKAGLKTLLAVPAVANKTTVAVLIFYTDTTPAEGSQEMALITAVVSELGLTLQQKQTEDELRKLSRAVEQSATGIFITDLDGRIEFINPAFTQISGYTDAEIIGKTPSVLRSDQTAQSAHHDLWATLQQGKTWEGRLLNRCKDGSLVWLQNIISPIKDQNGNATHYLSIQSDISQQVKAETALKASEAQNRALIETIPDLMFLINKDGVFIQSYGSNGDYLMPPDEFLNRNVADILPPAIVKETMVAIETTLLTGETSQFDYALFLTNENTLGHYEARFSRASADSVLALIRDVTHEWQTTEWLRESQHKLARAQALAHLGSWEWVFATGQILWSDEMYRISGYEPQSFEVVTKKVYEMVHPEDMEMVTKITQQTIATGQPYENEYRLQRPSGEVRYIRGRGELLTDENGDPMRLVEASLDITEEVLALQKIEQTNKIAQQVAEKLEKAQELAHLGNWEWTIASGKLIWSDETYRIFGYAPQSFEITYDKFVEMVYPADVVLLERSITQAINARLPYQVKHRLQRPSGEIRFVLERAELYTDENGNPIRMVGAVLDITDQTLATQNLRKEKKKAEYLQQEAERANQAKSLFLTNMSHELRTPLNGILGYTQLFLQDKTLSAQQLHGINVIHRSGEHLLFMINDMLDLSKIEAGKMTLSIGEYHLSEMLTSLVDMVGQLAAQKGIDFSHRLAAGLPQKVMTDGVRLRQILLNLLSNAVKFTDTGAVLLEVSPVKPTTTPPNTNQSSMRIRFRVEDTGIGIAPELLETIFRPFEQVGTTENKIDGTGLGLAISQRLATLLGGTLKVSSRLNKGSIFWFDLDLQIAQDSERITENTNFTIMPISGVQGDKKLRLLIVDDAESNRYLLKSYLSTLSGFELMEAHDGKDAITKAATFKPHVILMDLRMPVMDGTEAARQIRLLPSFEKGIIIALSASAYATIGEDILDAGFDDFIIKPLKLTQLSEKIKLFLGNEWEWTYNQKEVTPDKKIETGFIQIKPLPEEETAVLLDLTQTGDIKNLRNKLNIFRKNLDPQYHPTIDKLAQLTRQYRVKQIRELLENL